MADSQVAATGQYLTFRLEEEVFALDISTVREVLDFTTVTKVPKMPDYLRGVINLRGSVVPVVDLKPKFGMGKTEKTVNTCVIITEVKFEEDVIILGVLADSVQEVLEIGSDSIEPAPKIGTKLRNEFIKGMGKRNETFIIILDIDKVFSADEIATAQRNDSNQPSQKAS